MEISTVNNSVYENQIGSTLNQLSGFCGYSATGNSNYVQKIIEENDQSEGGGLEGIIICYKCCVYLWLIREISLLDDPSTDTYVTDPEDEISNFGTSTPESSENRPPNVSHFGIKFEFALHSLL